jgi:hypothetical protein
MADKALRGGQRLLELMDNILIIGHPKEDDKATWSLSISSGNGCAPVLENGGWDFDRLVKFVS